MLVALTLLIETINMKTIFIAVINSKQVFRIDKFYLQYVKRYLNLFTNQ